MPRGGRYRYTRVTLWTEPSFQRASADAKLLELALRTGSCSSFPGINVYFAEQIERDTGLRPGEIRNAFAELEKAGLNVPQCLFLLGAAALTAEELTAPEIAALIRYVHLTEPQAMMAVAAPLRELLTGTNRLKTPGLAA